MGEFVLFFDGIDITMIHKLQRGAGDFRESEGWRDSILLPTAPLVRDYEKLLLTRKHVFRMFMNIERHLPCRS